MKLRLKISHHQIYIGVKKKNLKVVLYHFKLTRFWVVFFVKKKLYQAFPLLLALLSFSLLSITIVNQSET